MGIFFSILAAVAYGLSDFLAGTSSRKYSVLGLVTSAYPISILIVLITLPFIHGTLSASAFFYGAISGLTLAVAILAFYSALSLGPISIVSISTSLLSSGIPVAYGLFLGEQISFFGKIGLVFALFAGLLFGLQHGVHDKDNQRRLDIKVIFLIFCAGIAFAGSFIITHKIPHGSGMLPIFFARITGFLVFLLFSREKLIIFTNHPRKLWSIYLVGVLDAIANITMYLAFQYTALSIATVIISAYPVFTIIPAFIFLKERIGTLQILGLLMSISAIFLLAV
jgi:drug/metabolite transporter (DMT)-like permease